MNCTRRVLTVTAIALLMLTVATSGAQAANGGNSENAKLCQKDGWMGLVTSTGAPFAREGECVAYAAGGGALTPKSAATLLFEFGTCSASLICPGTTLVGTGLMPGDYVYHCVRFANPTTRPEYCAPAFVNGGFVVVEADGTLPDHLAAYEDRCTLGDVHTYSAQTAEGTYIRSSDVCEL